MSLSNYQFLHHRIKATLLAIVGSCLIQPQAVAQDSNTEPVSETLPTLQIDHAQGDNPDTFTLTLTSDQAFTNPPQACMSSSSNQSSQAYIQLGGAFDLLSADRIDLKDDQLFVLTKLHGEQNDEQYVEILLASPDRYIECEILGQKSSDTITILLTLSGRSYPSFGQKLEGNWERVQDDPSGLTNRLQIAEIGFEIDTGTSIFYYKSSSRSSENKYTFNVADIGLGRQNNVYKIEFFRDDEPFFETLYRVTESDNGSETLELQNVLAGSSLPEQFEPDLTFQKSE